jgi:hypothetical protein
MKPVVYLLESTRVLLECSLVSVTSCFVRDTERGELKEWMDGLKYTVR